MNPLSAAGPRAVTRLRARLSRLGTLTLSGMAVASLSACGSSSGDHLTASHSGGDATATTTSTTAISASSVGAGPVAVSAALLADPGLPSQLGRAPIAQTKLVALVQYLEDHVADAYAHGDPDELYHYLAGTMLTGNRGTINVLNGQKKRNVFQVRVNSVTVDTTDPNQIVADMDADLTRNYFVDAKSGAVLSGGLPGPSHVDFELFLDYYPANHTWYWTGEQDQSSGGGTGGSGG